MKYFLLILPLLPALSQADSLYTGAWSYHAWKAEHVSNSEHNLIAYEYKGIVIGKFKNSYDDDTIVLAKQFELYDNNNIRVAVNVGLTHGYRDCVHVEGPEEGKDGTTCFAMAPEISYTKYKIQPTFMILANAMTIIFKWEIK